MAQDPDLRRGLRFRIGDAFPSEDVLARWATVLSMALNDMVLVQGKLVQPSITDRWPTYERQYSIRLAASHLFELATFLGASHRRHPEVRAFVDGLDVEYIDRHTALVSLGEHGQGPLREQLKRARNHFSHYHELFDRSRVEREELRRVTHDAKADQGEIMLTPTMRTFRAQFADEIVARLTFPLGITYAEGDPIPEEVLRFTRMLGEQFANVIAFGNYALSAYVSTLSQGTYEQFEE